MDTTIADQEFVVLLDSASQPCGVALKRDVHGLDTPLHLAFSCYVFDHEGRVLVTRRALDKHTWPGTWTNSFCGHPGPTEPMDEAVRRRGRAELGLELDELQLILPEFHYRAVAVDGVVENEFCPVWVARATNELRPNPDEVCDWSWMAWADLLAMNQTAPFMLSPWAQLQLDELKIAAVPGF
jgi:isopentenyl-diphosphate delta-isomerase